MNNAPFISGHISSSTQGVFAFPIYDEAVAKALSETGGWATEEIQMLERLVNQDDEVLIVGGHLGTVAIPISRAVKKVAVVEANPDIYKYLTVNLLLNEVNNVEPLNVLASENGGFAQFLIGGANSGGSKIYPRNPHPHYLENVRRVVELRSSRLDDCFPNRKFRLVFMDIEGSEYFALKGMPNILAASDILFVEFIPNHLRYVAAIDSNQFAELISGFFNYLFIPGLGVYVERDNFASMLGRLYDLNYSQDQIVFTKQLADIQSVSGR